MFCALHIESLIMRYYYNLIKVKSLKNLRSRKNALLPSPSSYAALVSLGRDDYHAINQLITHSPVVLLRSISCNDNRTRFFLPLIGHAHQHIQQAVSALVDQMVHMGCGL